MPRSTRSAVAALAALLAAGACVAYLLIRRDAGMPTVSTVLSEGTSALSVEESAFLETFDPGASMRPVRERSGRSRTSGPVAESRLDTTDPVALLAAVRTETDEHLAARRVFELANAHAIDDAGVEVLTARLGVAGSRELRAALLWALGRAKSAKADSVVERATENEADPELRLLAHRMLFMEQKTEYALRALSVDPETRVRSQLASLLGAVAGEDTELVAALARAASSDPAASVRVSALEALAAVPTPSRLSVLDQRARLAEVELERRFAAQLAEELRAMADGDDLAARFAETPHPLSVGAHSDEEP